MGIHGYFGEQAGSASVGFFDNTFSRRSEDGQEACFGVDLRRVRAMALAIGGGVEPVYCAANVLPLWYFDTVWKYLDGQRVVCYFFSIGIQFRWCWIRDRSHLLCSFPFLKSSVHLRVGEKSGGRIT